MNNTLGNLNNYLFEEIERLQTAETPDEMDTAIRRANAVSGVADKIIKNADLALQAQKHFDQYAGNVTVDIPALGISSE